MLVLASNLESISSEQVDSSSVQRHEISPEKRACGDRATFISMDLPAQILRATSIRQMHPFWAIRSSWGIYRGSDHITMALGGLSLRILTGFVTHRFNHRNVHRFLLELFTCRDERVEL